MTRPLPPFQNHVINSRNYLQWGGSNLADPMEWPKSVYYTKVLGLGKLGAFSWFSSRKQQNTEFTQFSSVLTRDIYYIWSFGIGIGLDTVSAYVERLRGNVSSAHYIILMLSGGGGQEAAPGTPWPDCTTIMQQRARPWRAKYLGSLLSVSLH